MRSVEVSDIWQLIQWKLGKRNNRGMNNQEERGSRGCRSVVRPAEVEGGPLRERMRSKEWIKNCRRSLIGEWTF